MATDPSNIQFRDDARVNRDSKLFRGVRRCYLPILHGRVLVVDPSIGSQSSQPGYAIYVAGKLAEYGTIEIRPTDSTHLRLYELGRTLREEFDGGDAAFDVLVIEDLPLARYEGGGWRGPKGRSLEAQVPLHRAVGAILSSVRVDHCVAVHPLTWHSFVSKDYEKSDAGDAVVMGHVALRYATEAAEEAIRPKARRKKGA